MVGECMFRVLLLRQPRSGLPGLNADDRLTRVPVCGTQDVGRGFWKKFCRSLIARGECLEDDPEDQCGTMCM